MEQQVKRPGSLWRKVGHVVVFLLVTLVLSSLLGAALIHLGEAFPTAKIDPGFATLLCLVLGIIAAVVVVLRRVRRRPMRPVWLALGVFAVIWLGVLGYSTHVSANLHEAARHGPVVGIYPCAAPLFVYVQPAHAIGISDTHRSYAEAGSWDPINTTRGPLTYTYDSLTHIIATESPSLRFRYVPLEQTGSVLEHEGPGIEVFQIYRGPNGREQNIQSVAWCPFDPRTPLDE